MTLALIVVGRCPLLWCHLLSSVLYFPSHFPEYTFGKPDYMKYLTGAICIPSYNPTYISHLYE